MAGSAALVVVLFCAYGRDLYTGLTCNILVLYSCTVYRLYSVYSTNALPGQAVRVVLKNKPPPKKSQNLGIAEFPVG